MDAELRIRGFKSLVAWSWGVDTEQFQPVNKTGSFTGPLADAIASPKRPFFEYAGRVAVEKNLTAFLSLDLPGSKVVIGDGPD